MKQRSSMPRAGVCRRLRSSRVRLLGRPHFCLSLLRRGIFRLSFLYAVLGCAFWISATERLGRGLVAVERSDGSVFISWRLLADDRPGTAFDLFRSETRGAPAQRLNDKPITDSCNFVDSHSASNGFYFVSPAGQQPGPATGKWIRPIERDSGFVRLKLQGDYAAQKVGIADLNGDGRYDYLVKQPDFNTDPYQQPGYWKKSEGTYKLEAYDHDGLFLWRHDMGWAIEEGIWYSPVLVYDLDGDGKAEVFCKGGEGDPREPAGHVKSGAEYLLVLDGQTGAVRRRLPWLSRDGFDSYNYYSRNLLGVAYLDGKRAHLVVERGTYKIIKIQAYQPDLTPLWYWEASGQYDKYRGQGMHGMHAADVDDDGRDELVIGGAVIDDDGKPLWNLGKGHPDICYVADVAPLRPGLEIFYGIEPGRQSNTVCLVEAKSGRMIWGSPEVTVHVHGQGMVGDIDPSYPGMECYTGEAKGGSNYWLYSASGERLSEKSLGELSPKAIFWLDGTQKAFVVNKTIFKWPREKVGSIQGQIVAVADCLGDWREELVTSLKGEVRIYTTTIPTATRRVCLMQDRLYRTDVAMQTMGYFYPPQLSKP